MNINELLMMEEGPKLDFKSIWKREEILGEYIKDIVSIANGNPSALNQEGLLVFGVSDDKSKIFSITDDMLFGIGKSGKSLKSLENHLLSKLNDAVHPAFLGISLDFLEAGDGKRVLLVRIPFHPYILSLSRNLEVVKGVKKMVFRKGTVFFRVGEEINIASPEVIDAFRRKSVGCEELKKVTINNKDTKVAMQNSVNNGNQTFNF